MAHHLNIPPRAQDEMTAQEWAQAVQAVDLIRKEHDKASQ